MHAGDVFLGLLVLIVLLLVPYVVKYSISETIQPWISTRVYITCSLMRLCSFILFNRIHLYLIKSHFVAGRVVLVHASTVSFVEAAVHSSWTHFRVGSYLGWLLAWWAIRQSIEVSAFLLDILSVWHQLLRSRITIQPLYPTWTASLVWVLLRRVHVMARVVIHRIQRLIEVLRFLRQLLFLRCPTPVFFVAGWYSLTEHVVIEFGGSYRIVVLGVELLDSIVPAVWRIVVVSIDAGLSVVYSYLRRQVGIIEVLTTMILWLLFTMRTVPHLKFIFIWRLHYFFNFKIMIIW